MRSKIKICALILARGGSKRLPKKNIKFFNGKPLISWTVISAINSNRFDKVYCYSDDSKILDACIIEGAEVPFDRPKKVSGDYISSLDTMRLFFGINLSERFYGFGNYHNSFVLLHARIGFYMFIITLMFSYSLIKAYKVNYLLASCLLVLLFRSLTDTSILAGSPFDFVLFFLIFFLGRNKNKSI